MTEIKTLTDKYAARAQKVRAQMETMDKLDKEQGRDAEYPQVIVPDYAKEVIRPVIKLLQGALPEYPIQTPSGRKSLPIKDYYRLTVGVACIGGFSCPTWDDCNLYFTPMFKQKPQGKQQKIDTLEQLVEIVKVELNKRGLLILPEHL